MIFRARKELILIPIAVAVFLAIGCYTLIRHPDLQADDQGPTHIHYGNVCTDCHGRYHDFYPYPAFRSDYSYYRWRGYYDYPWWWDWYYYPSYDGDELLLKPKERRFFGRRRGLDDQGRYSSPSRRRESGGRGEGVKRSSPPRKENKQERPKKKRRGLE